MDRPLMMAKGALARLRQSAVAAWQRQDYPQYFKIMEQAAGQDPANSAPPAMSRTAPAAGDLDGSSQALHPKVVLARPKLEMFKRLDIFLAYWKGRW